MYGKYSIPSTKVSNKKWLFHSFHPNRHFNPIHTFRELHSTSFENCPISLRVSPAPNISQTATKGTPTRYGHGRPPASWALLVEDQTSKRWKVQLGTEVTQGTKSFFHKSAALLPSNPEKPMFKRFLLNNYYSPTETPRVYYFWCWSKSLTQAKTHTHSVLDRLCQQWIHRRSGILLEETSTISRSKEWRPTKWLGQKSG